MKLEDGIQSYVERKQAIGIAFTHGHKTYLAFLKAVGNLSLSEINGPKVMQFLNRPHLSALTFRRDHSLLRHFFDYWAARGTIARLPMPPNRPVQRSKFLPYIYTREELRRLIRLAPSCTTRNDKIHPRTLRVMLLTLYATGARVGEVIRLVNNDVDLPNSFITFSNSRLKRSRRVPIGKDLARILQQYVERQKRMGACSESFFTTIDGSGISLGAFRSRFKRLRRKAGITGYNESGLRPCARDLRATFAVHQITSWIKKKRDLNLMLPALGAYLGHSSLGTTERYLQLTPERFQNALNKLSPQKPHTRWRDDPALLEFLSNL